MNQWSTMPFQSGLIVFAQWHIPLGWLQENDFHDPFCLLQKAKATTVPSEEKPAAKDEAVQPKADNIIYFDQYMKMALSEPYR